MRSEQTNDAKNDTFFILHIFKNYEIYLNLFEFSILNVLRPSGSIGLAAGRLARRGSILMRRRTIVQGRGGCTGKPCIQVKGCTPYCACAYRLYGPGGQHPLHGAGPVGLRIQCSFKRFMHTDMLVSIIELNLFLYKKKFIYTVMKIVRYYFEVLPKGVPLFDIFHNFPTLHVSIVQI